MLGSCTRPRAISTRRRMPPDRFFTCLSAHGVSSTASSSSSIRRVRLARGTPYSLAKDEQVLVHAQLEVAGHGLRDDADRFAHAVGLRHDVEAVDAGAARGRQQQGRQHPDERRFAGTVWPEQTENLTRFDGEADTVHRGKRAEALDDLSTSMADISVTRRGARTRSLPTAEAAVVVVDAHQHPRTF